MKFCRVKYSLLVLGLISFSSYSQEIKMNSLINVGSASITAPAISGDGSRMVYLSDYSSTGDYVMMMSENKGG